MTIGLLDASAAAITSAVAGGRTSAREVIEAALARIEARNAVLGAFTDVTAARALARADAIDAARARGNDPRAARRRAVRGQEPVRHRGVADARRFEDQSRPRSRQRGRDLVARLEAAGAILVGALNMGEYAYDFTGENAHDGPSRNPHDPRT